MFDNWRGVLLLQCYVFANSDQRMSSVIFVRWSSVYPPIKAMVYLLSIWELSSKWRKFSVGVSFKLDGHVCFSELPTMKEVSQNKENWKRSYSLLPVFAAKCNLCATRRFLESSRLHLHPDQRIKPQNSIWRTTLF